MPIKLSMMFRVSLGMLFCMFGLHFVPEKNFQFIDAAYGATSDSLLSDSLNGTGYKDILIRFRAETSLEEREMYLASISGELLMWIAPIHTASVRVPSSFSISKKIVEVETGSGNAVNGTAVVDESAAASTHRQLSLATVALSVEEDGMVYGTAEPDDPDLYREQRVYTAKLLNLFEAWDYTMGTPEVTVAVLDTGIASAHPEFTGRIKDGYDFYNDDDDPEDDHGHGTHVSGTIAAAVGNGMGSAGICGRCSILPVKVLNQNNAGTWSGVAAGITYAADEDADIIVMSLGSTSGTKVVEDAIDYAISKDVLIIAAAGNANSNRNFYPAAYDGVIGVAATNQKDERWVLSNYGSYVDVSAPGHVIYSTSNDLDNAYNGHVYMSGTSMATPHVGGLAGLLKSQDTTRTSIEITDILLRTAFDLGDAGRDDHFGMGRIDPVAALSYDQSALPTATLGGNVWHDTNADGLISNDEQIRLSGANITLYDAQNQAIASAQSNANGAWLFTDLRAGTYRISAIASDPTLIWTTENEATVTLSSGQQLVNSMVGFVDKLPSDVVKDTKAYRQDNEVLVVWQVDSELVSGLTLERSIGGDGSYELIRWFDMTLAGAGGALQSFTDRLPDNIGDETVFYRIQVTPGNTYVSTFEALDQGTTPPITAVPPVRTIEEGAVFLPLMYAKR